MTDDRTPDNYKPRRKQRPKDDFGSTTKKKGAPVVGKQATTLFGAGPNAPKPGVTSAQRILAIRAAELAAKLQVDFLEEIDSHVTKARKSGASADVIATLTTNVLNLMKDAMDREFGKAGQTLDLTTNGESVAPTQIQLVAVRPTDDSAD